MVTTLLELLQFYGYETIQRSRVMKTIEFNSPQTIFRIAESEQNGSLAMRD